LGAFSSYHNRHHHHNNHRNDHHYAGRILGKALMDGQITPVHLIQPLYKHLMGWPVTFKDLEHIDDQVLHAPW
jgi:E3 ubiquitin-protein ligase NEDD4